ncbi:MAG TPA: thioredoxin domain-containing protein [Allosphingosinicella sp.]|uniref:thioredoxin domain-containing protein n=1 Tax=Allosphingosinicella sp. TaxID=2823234 RepID=UPI002ED7A9E0
MKAFIGAASVSMALVLAGCGGSEGGNNSSATAADNTPLKQVEAPNGDWTLMVEQTQDGGFRMGNPNAPVKLIEYASLTCPACAQFSATGSEPLKNKYVKSGQVSWEFRNLVRDPADLAAVMLTRCQGPQPFFRLTEQLFANQQTWLGGFSQVPEAEMQRIQTMPREQQVGAIARAAGLDQFFRQRGMPEARINSCLADQQGLQSTVALNEVATRDNVQGTPTFLINGEFIQSSADWNALEAELREAIG